VAKADRQYTLEHGMRVINLPEVLIKGIKRNRNDTTSFGADYSFSSEEIAKSGAPYIYNFLRRKIPRNITQTTSAIVIDGLLINYIEPTAIQAAQAVAQARTSERLEPGQTSGYQTPTLSMWMSKAQYVQDMLSMVDIEEVGRIDVYSGSINIRTKRGILHTSLPSFNIKPAMPLGYQLPVEFYSPKYDTQEKIDDSKPDLRTTIYWKPNVITDDKGNAKLDFYTADDSGTYSVIIEGVSEDGRLIHYCGKFAIKIE